MRTHRAVLFSLFLTCTGLIAQVPTINSIQNPASNILPGMPNFGIARGSIFVLYGSGLGPATIAIAPTLPYGLSYGGTSVAITAGGQTFNAPIIYSLNTQVAAVMPSTVPVGNATVTVTYNKASGGNFPTLIAQNNFGISTVDQSGSGAAAITTPSYALITNANSAIPGSVYTLWGTGLGPATGTSTDTNVNGFGNIGPAVTVYVGGVASPNVTYYGRSPGAGPGLDQINFTIPTGVSGCAVSLVVVTSGTLSNTTTIPIAPNGGACSDPIGLPPSTLTPLLALSGGINLAYFQMKQTASVTFPPPANSAVTTQSAQASATFAGFTQSQLTAASTSIFRTSVSLGSCIVSNGQGGSDNISFTGLDAGTSVTYAPPTGSPIVMTSQGGGSYSATSSLQFPSGTYTVTNGSGGTKIGALSGVTFTVPTPVTWTNQTTLQGSTVSRSTPLTITWTGGSAGANGGGYVDIQGSAPFSQGSNGGVTFECAAPVSAGSFTIPVYVLQALPPFSGSLQVGSNFGQVVTAANINLAVASGNNTTSVLLTWK